MLPGHMGGKGGWVGFFNPPAGVRSKGEQEEVANKEYLIFFFLLRIHYTPVRMLMRKRTGKAAENAFLASMRHQHKWLSCSDLAVEYIR